MAPAFGYAAGTAAGTITVPAGARLRSVSVLAGAEAATLVIDDGDLITIPAGDSFSDTLAAEVEQGVDVIIGGTPAAYYISWGT